MSYEISCLNDKIERIIMPLEIERKFLVNSSEYRNNASCFIIRQGYLCTDPDRTTRVRVYNGKGYLTIKGKTRDIAREEYEYDIPFADAERILDNLCIKPLIEKRRYIVYDKDQKWEIDEFFGVNEGLIIAEIELKSTSQKFDKPEWLGIEVSDDVRYYNSNLSVNPYSQWK